MVVKVSTDKAISPSSWALAFEPGSTKTDFWTLALEPRPLSSGLWTRTFEPIPISRSRLQPYWQHLPPTSELLLLHLISGVANWSPALKLAFSDLVLFEWGINEIKSKTEWLAFKQTKYSWGGFNLENVGGGYLLDGKKFRAQFLAFWEELRNSFFGLIFL